jgi:hypothetical protein
MGRCQVDGCYERAEYIRKAKYGGLKEPTKTRIVTKICKEHYRLYNPQGLNTVVMLPNEETKKRIRAEFPEESITDEAIEAGQVWHFRKIRTR